MKRTVVSQSCITQRLALFMLFFYWTSVEYPLRKPDQPVLCINAEILGAEHTASEFCALQSHQLHCDEAPSTYTDEEHSAIMKCELNVLHKL